MLIMYLEKTDIKQSTFISPDNGSCLGWIKNKIFVCAPIRNNCINKHTVCIHEDINKIMK